MQQYKMIVADLDDTLLNDNLQVSAENKEAIRKAQNLGLIFTIATGRMFQSAQVIAREMGVTGHIISYQGALVKTVETEEVLVEQSVPFDLAADVLKEGYAAGVHINLYLNDQLYVDTVTPEGIGYVQQSDVGMNPVGNLIDFLDTSPTKILFIAEPDLLDDLQHRLQEKYGSALYITKSKPFYLEFLHPQATKGHALKLLAEKLSIDREAIIAFGDSYNDIEMLEYAGMGVAMGNAPEAIKKIADQVTASNDESGIARFLEKFLLNPGSNE